MPSLHSIQASCYVEMLARSISQANPYFKQSPMECPWEECERNVFPSHPGVYAILRRVSIAGSGYRYAGLNPISPIVLYIGRTSARRSIRQRLRDHFGCKQPNYQGSQFVKFLMQVVQDETAVKRILWSPSTLVACVGVTDGEQVLETVERLAMQVFSPRFNIKDR